MKKIEAYELTNGEILTNEEKAIKRQKIIDFEGEINEFANNLECYSEEADLIARTIIENVEELKKIFDAI